jgi:acyl carrier protein
VNTKTLDTENLDLAALEQSVIDAVRKVLAPAEPVTRASDFFELGGNSILGARLVAQLREVFGVKVTIRDIFRARTVELIASAVAARRAAT